MRLFTSSLIALTMAAPALAAEVTAASLVTAATVFPSGALVTRTAVFDATAGQHEIIIDDLPLDFAAGTLRVEGAGSAAFTIVSVDHRTLRLPPIDPEELPEQAAVEAVEAEIRDLEAANRAEQAAIAAADTADAFIQAMIAQQAAPPAEGAAPGIPPEGWSAAIAVLVGEKTRAGAARLAAEKALAENALKAGELQEKLTRALQALEAARIEPPPRSIATVTIEAPAPLEGSLAISYLTEQAGWEPAYDLRLSEGARPRLAVERHARIGQYTGEDWTGVALTLSTARATGQIEASLPWESIVDLYRRDQPIDGESNVAMAAPAEPALEMDDLAGGLSKLQRDVLPEVVAEEADVALAAVSTEGETVIYALPGLADVGGDGTIRQMVIDRAEGEVAVLARSAPEFDPAAYLYAGVKNSFGGPILPGRAAVWRDGAFVGEVGLPLIARGEEAMLPFGVLEGVKIARDVVSREDGDTGIIANYAARREMFRITAESLLDWPVRLTVFDRAPVSENEDLEVNVTASPLATETDFEGRRGVHAWTFDLAPGATRAIDFGYELTWPEDMEIFWR